MLLLVATYLFQAIDTSGHDSTDPIEDSLPQSSLGDVATILAVDYYFELVESDQLNDPATCALVGGSAASSSSISILPMEAWTSTGTACRKSGKHSCPSALGIALGVSAFGDETRLVKLPGRQPQAELAPKWCAIDPATLHGSWLARSTVTARRHVAEPRAQMTPNAHYTSCRSSVHSVRDCYPPVPATPG